MSAAASRNRERTGVLMYNPVSEPKLCFSSVSSPSSVLRFTVLFSLSSVHWSVVVKEHEIQCTTNLQQIDNILPSFVSQNSSLKMFFRVISGNSTIVMLAHRDHKHKNNLSSTKKVNWFWISHIFCMATNLHMSNCRFQMSESAISGLRIDSPDCFQQ